MADPLSPSDRSSLAAERGSVNMAIAGVIVLEHGPGVTYDALCTRIAERIHLLPRYRQRLEQPAMGLANPVWVDDEHFDVHWHVRQTTLPAPGGEKELAAYVGRDAGRRMDRSRPLWELWFVDGVRTRVRTAARYAGPETAAFLATITPAQVEALQRKWDKDNKKYVKDHKVNGTPEERQEHEAKRIVKTFKEWLTPLNSEQEQGVAVMVRDLPPIDQFRYTERLRRQKELLSVLALACAPATAACPVPFPVTASVTCGASSWSSGRVISVSGCTLWS